MTDIQAESGAPEAAPIVPRDTDRLWPSGEVNAHGEATQGEKILIADDQAGILSALRLLLKFEGFHCATAESPSEILAAIRKERFELLLMDLNFARDTTSGREGLELLNAIKRMPSAPPVVVMTAWGSVELAVEAMRKGARDFVLKPWDNQRLIEIVREQVRIGTSAQYSEHALASQVQRRLMPQRVPQLATLDLAALCCPAGAVSGDYYDFIPLGNGRTAIVLADISGKGMPAALLMANLQATLRTLVTGAEQDVARMIDAVNRLFYESTSSEYFATLFFGVYDDCARRLRYVNCGHQPPVLLRRDGAVDRLLPTVTVLGLFADVRCESAEVEISAGDLLVAFSDGVTEAQDPAGDDFGDERLVSVMRKLARQPVDAVPDAIAGHLEQFAPRPWADDVTILAARGV